MYIELNKYICTLWADAHSGGMLLIEGQKEGEKNGVTKDRKSVV